MNNNNNNNIHSQKLLDRMSTDAIGKIEAVSRLLKSKEEYSYYIAYLKNYFNSKKGVEK